MRLGWFQWQSARRRGKRGGLTACYRRLVAEPLEARLPLAGQVAAADVQVQNPPANAAPSFTMRTDSFFVSDEQPSVNRVSNISFDGLSGHLGDGDLLTGYSEGGFDVAPQTGRWMIMTTVSPTPDVLGNPAPSIWEDTFTASLNVSRTGGGVFRFGSIDFTRGTSYTLTGSLGGKTVYTLSGTVPAGPAGFVTIYNASTAVIDLLQIAVVRSDVESTNLDNIRLSVPVPSETVPEWLTNRSAGPPEEAGQALTLTVSNNNNSLFLDQPAIDYKGTLTFTPAPNNFGNAVVTVTLKDDGGTLNGGVDSYSQTFEIAVTKPHPWHNQAEGLDVTHDGSVVPKDALEVINFLNAFGSQPVPLNPAAGSLYYDVSGDNFVAPNDVLSIINHLNSGALASLPPTDGGPGSAAFVGVDSSTQGNWPALYGADGYALASGSTSLPSYASLMFTGGLTDLYDDISAMSTADPRALQKPGASDRLLAAWTGDYGFTIDLNIADGRARQVAIYLLDPNGSRSERLDVIDAATGSVLDSQTVGDFGTGKYVVWNLSGHVQIRFTNLANGLNAVASGLLFG